MISDLLRPVGLVSQFGATLFFVLSPMRRPLKRGERRRISECLNSVIVNDLGKEDKIVSTLNSVAERITTNPVMIASLNSLVDMAELTCWKFESRCLYLSLLVPAGSSGDPFRCHRKHMLLFMFWSCCTSPGSRPNCVQNSFYLNEQPYLCA